MISFRRIAAFVTAVILTMTAMASYPPVRNFPYTVHSGGTQTWAVEHSDDGVMYFANKNGLLSFDSDTWSLQPVKNGSTVRALFLDRENRRLYAGASEEFGYFAPDSATGNPVYTCLSDRIGKGHAPFKEIWNIFKVDGAGEIWFQSDNDLFMWDGTKITSYKYPRRITASVAFGGRVYIATAGAGVSVLIDGNEIHPDGNDIIAPTRVVAMLPCGDGLMIVTEYHGIFMLRAGHISQIHTPIDGFLKQNQVFSASCSGNRYAFGTVSGGVAVYNFVSGRTAFANTRTGLQNNTVLTSRFTPDGCLWLGLDNGIDVVYIDSPYYSLLGEAGTYGAGYMSLVAGNRLYLGTNQGLYTMEANRADSPVPPDLTGLLRGQVWDISEIGGRVMVCTDAGLFCGSGSAFSAIEGVSGCWCILPLRAHPGYALVSAYNSFYLLHREGDAWTNLGPVSGYNDIGGHFTEDNDGSIWIAHWLKGVYKLRIDTARRRFSSIRFYNSKKGLPTDRNIGVTTNNNRPLFLTEGGFYRYDAAADMMRPDTRLNDVLGPAIAPRLHTAPDGRLWCVAGNAISVVSYDNSGRVSVDSVSYSPLADKLIPGFDNFNFVNDNRLLISMQDGFFDVNPAAVAEPVKGSAVYFKALRASGDTVLNYVPRLMDSHIILPYSQNSLRFEAVAPEYRGDKQVAYSFMLDNYDSGWSDWSVMPFKEYTQLQEGDYTIRVRALNNFTKEINERVLHFSVLPPWFRSTPAKVVYLILTLILMFLSYKAIRLLSLRASVKVARRKQSELDTIRRQAKEESLLKDYEIAELKGRQLEQDIKHKTAELSNITMNVVRKNEILLDISSRLEKLAGAESTSDISRQLTRIQSIIRENINHDDDWRNFMHNFDAAYEDFTKRLQERHPDLTPTELRTCCYLKMGLSSKDIAPLFNISYRSVEMTRYRLRKKLGLNREDNLTEYLQKL